MNKKTALILIYAVFAINGCTVQKDDSGSHTKEFSTPPTPEIRFTVEYDCESPNQPQVKPVNLPPQVVKFVTKFRRTQHTCTPAEGKAEDETCSQQVWEVLVDYDFKSDLSRDATPFHNTDIKVGEIVCQCTCVKGGAKPCPTNPPGVIGQCR